VGDPEVAVPDELTTGLDPHARQQTWALIESVRGRGVPVVVVTHSMQEAEQLCDRVAVIDHGRLVACGTPAELREQGGGVTRMSFRPSGPIADRLLTSLPDVTSVHRQGDRVVLTGTDEVVTDVILALNEAGTRAQQVSVESSSLEQAFLTLTGEDFPPPPRGHPGAALAAVARAADRVCRRHPNLPLGIGTSTRCSMVWPCGLFDRCVPALTPASGNGVRNARLSA
jgi:ABC-2 type transport system ATP-binding protein